MGRECHGQSIAADRLPRSVRMKVSYYKLASDSFSLANYRRKDGQPDVERDWEAIEDAAACIAQAMKKDPHYGPVVLVVHDGPALGRSRKARPP